MPSRCLLHLRQRHRAILLAAAMLGAILFSSSAALAQACPSPAVANGASCTQTGGTLTSSTAAVPGLSALNAGTITATGVTVNLTATGVGAQAQSAGVITITGGSVIKTTTSATGQRGVISTSGGQVNVTGGSITVGLAGNVANQVGVLAQGGAVSLNGTAVSTLATGLTNHAAWATGVGSSIVVTGGSLKTAGGRSIGAFAENGGTITLSGGTTVTTTGNEPSGNPGGSHALFASGTGSSINGTGISLSTSGTTANGARAENGGSVSLVGSTITSSSAAAATKLSSGLSAFSGGSVSLTGPPSSITMTGQRGHGMSVEGATSQGTLSNVTVSVTGTLANDVLVDGGHATITNSTLTNSTNVGIVVKNGGSLTMSGTSVATSFTNGMGIQLAGGSTATVTGGSVTTTGPTASVGVIVANSTFTGTGMTILTTGDGRPYGVLADGGSNVTMNGGTVTTTGNATDPSTSNARRPEGMVAQNPNALLHAIGTTVHTTGNEGFGVVADDGGVMVLDGVPITTHGTLGLGIYATTEQIGPQFTALLTANNGTVETFGVGGWGAGADQNFLEGPTILTLNNETLTTHGLRALGLFSQATATINANDTTVLTEGTNAHGMRSRDEGTSVNIDNTTVTTLGTAAHGGVAERGGLITGIDSTVTASGSNSAALFVVGEPGVFSAAEFNHSQLTNLSGPTIGVAGPGRVQLTNNSFAGGSGHWLLVGTVDDFPLLGVLPPRLVNLSDSPEPPTAEDGSAPNDTPANPPLGAPPVGASTPGLANILIDHSVVTGDAVTLSGSVSNVTMQNDSLWNMTGSSNLTFLLNDPSFIQFSPPVADPTVLSNYMTLTVHNYVGEGGGLGLNTFLGDDSSPSDRLVIETGGSATGTSGLTITNTTGPGAKTLGDGILVVDAKGTAVTDPTAFHLNNTVQAGVYKYDLFRSGVEGLPETDSDWFLRSAIDCPPLGGPPTAADPCIPIIRPGVPLALADAGLMDLYGRQILDTLHQRVGDNSPTRPLYTDPVDTPYWGRAIGVTGTHQGDPLGIYGSMGPRYDFGIAALQGGVDLRYSRDEEGGTDRAGLYGVIGGARADVTHFVPILGPTAGGTSSLYGYSLGGYWTHYKADGSYLDAIIQGTFYSLGYDDGFGGAGSTNGVGLAASLEAGHPVDLGDGYIIEPQAQVISQVFDVAPFSDGISDVSFSNLGSIVARVGFRLARDWTVETADGQKLPASAWGFANLWHQIVGQPSTTFSSDDGPHTFQADLRTAWLELGFGADLRTEAENVDLYGTLSYSVGLDGRTNSLAAKAGIKGQF